MINKTSNGMNYLLEMPAEQLEQLANAALAEADKLPPYHPQRLLHLQEAFAALHLAERNRPQAELDLEEAELTAIDLGLDPNEPAVRKEIEALAKSWAESSELTD